MQSGTLLPVQSDRLLWVSHPHPTTTNRPHQW